MFRFSVQVLVSCIALIIDLYHVNDLKVNSKIFYKMTTVLPLIWLISEAICRSLTYGE